MWLVGGGVTFGRRAASGFAGGRKKSCELAEGGLAGLPIKTPLTVNQKCRSRAAAARASRLGSPGLLDPPPDVCAFSFDLCPVLMHSLTGGWSLDTA